MRATFRFSKTPVDAEFELNIPSQAREIALPGFFYDRLFNRSERLVGLRYWGMPSIKLDEKQISIFCEDPRFYFDMKNNFIDMVFYINEIDSLKRGELYVDSVQEFGGDRLFVLNDDIPFLVFDLAEY